MTATTFGPAWFPHNPPLSDDTAPFVTATDGLTLDADEEEAQMIGYVYLAAGSGSKTFGTSSKIAWLPGASITFADDGASDPTLRVGVKDSTQISTTSGPPARATIGAAAFNVYKDLVGGTDTISSTTWREDSMASGTGFTVNHGDLLAVCWHLDKPGAAAQSVKVRVSAGQAAVFQTQNNVLVTSGPTFTVGNMRSNVRLTFDDGTLGWLFEGCVFSVATATEAIGNGNIYGNIFRPPVPITIDAVAAVFASAGTTNITVGIWLASDPSTPIASVSVDPQQMATNSSRATPVLIPATALTANTDYVVGVKQNSATAINAFITDVDATTDWQMNGLDANCYAVKSSSGAAFAQQNSGKRRASCWFRVAKFDSGGGGSDRRGAMNGGVTQ